MNHNIGVVTNDKKGEMYSSGVNIHIAREKGIRPSGWFILSER